MDQDMPFKPSAYGFRSIKPKTRFERRSLKDKVALEKNRIKQRTGFAARIHNANAPETSAGLTSCVTGGAGYLSNSDRFHTDVVGEEYANRMQEMEKKKQVAEFKRKVASDRDRQRWEEMEEKQRREDAHWQKIRDEGKMSTKNKSKMAYDILTLQYQQNTDGEHQKYLDDMVRYRASIRTNQLVEHGDTRARYNIISGEDRAQRPRPDPVPMPGGQPSGRVDRRMSLQQAQY